MPNESWWTDVEIFRTETAIGALAESKVTFTTHCPIAFDFSERCHKFDLHCFPYVTFYVGSADVQWGGANFSAYEGVEFGKHRFYEIDASGNPNASPFGEPTSDGVGVVLNNCYITCLMFWTTRIRWSSGLSISWATGADGIFLDNLFTRQPCYGARLGIHPHVLPDPSNPTDASAQTRLCFLDAPGFGQLPNANLMAAYWAIPVIRSLYRLKSNNTSLRTCSRRTFVKASAKQTR